MVNFVAQAPRKFVDFVFNLNLLPSSCFQILVKLEDYVWLRFNFLTQVGPERQNLMLEVNKFRLRLKP